MSPINMMFQLYDGIMEKADPRVSDWLLLKSPLPIIAIFFIYLSVIFIGPRLMKNVEAFDLRYFIIVYNFILVYWSAYMFYEFLVTAILSNYSLICQPVDYSNDPLAIRMASVCWWFFFSKVFELIDTVFFILRKKNNQISFLHVYHHCTMIINWYLGARFVAGGQSFFLAMLNSFVHIWMYTYYALSAMGPKMRKYLWWKKYMTMLQLSQFFMVVLHTSVNMAQGSSCGFPQGYNYAVFLYTITLIILFSSFFKNNYKNANKKQIDSSNMQNGITHSNGYRVEKIE